MLLIFKSRRLVNDSSASSICLIARADPCRYLLNPERGKLSGCIGLRPGDLPEHLVWPLKELPITSLQLTYVNGTNETASTDDRCVNYEKFA
jgi:hypothetical protein